MTSWWLGIRSVKLDAGVRLIAAQQPHTQTELEILELPCRAQELVALDLGCERAGDDRAGFNPEERRTPPAVEGLAVEQQAGPTCWMPKSTVGITATAIAQASDVFMSELPPRLRPDCLSAGR